MPSLRKIHRCLRSRDMGGIHHSDMILLSMYHRSTDSSETSMRVKELGRCSNISPTALSRCLRQLEKEGLIRRTIDPSDRRSLRVQLTNAGTDRAARLDSDSNYCFDRIFQAMGDGNHSLATAKTAWENIKKTLSPEEIEGHPARYALCEIENIHDDGIVFEPIHRVIFAKKGQSGMDLVNQVVDLLGKFNGKAYLADADAAVPEGAFEIPYITGAGCGKIIIEEPENKLEVGALQHVLDIMVKENKDCDIDYIHGTEAVNRIGARDGNAGFMLPAMDKFMLFPAVAADGALPRKTFSMGEANEKRYYIEARYIAK